MGMTSPSREQLVAKLTDSQQARLRTREAGTPEPAAQELAAAVGLVDMHTAGRTVAAAVLAAWALDIAAHRLGVLLDDPTDRQRELHDQAFETLTAIRDGRFSSGAPPDSSIPASAAISYGSQPDIFATTT
jgi:hypothetical protein